METNNQNEQEFVYLARILTESAGKRLELLLNGEDPKIIGSTPQDNSFVLSDVSSKLNLDLAPNKVEAFRWLENYKKMQKIRSYYMIGNSLDDIADSINTLAFQPNTEVAYQKLLNGKTGRMEDYFAYNRPVMAVIKLPISELDRLLTQGYAEKRTGDYGTDIERSQLDEITLGDDALRQIYKNNQFMYYGPIHKVMDKISSTPFDTKHIFKYDYMPSTTIGLENTQNKVSFNSQELSPEAKVYYDAFVEVMNRPKEERDFILPSFKEMLDKTTYEELLNYYSQNEGKPEM
ncbi:MAG: hypothetical protein ACI4PF_02290 [Christensenellales bacterium]